MIHTYNIHTYFVSDLMKKRLFFNMTSKQNWWICTNHTWKDFSWIWIVLYKSMQDLRILWKRYLVLCISDGKAKMCLRAVSLHYDQLSIYNFSKKKIWHILVSLTWEQKCTQFDLGHPVLYHILFVIY